MMNFEILDYKPELKKLGHALGDAGKSSMDRI
jgi:hypothetical protein